MALLKRSWTPRDIEQLKILFCDETVNWETILESLPGRSPGGIRRQAWLLGLKRPYTALRRMRSQRGIPRPRWGIEELEQLKSAALDPNVGWDGPGRSLNARTKSSIRSKASALSLVKAKSPFLHSLKTKSVRVNLDFFKEPSLLNSYWAGFLAGDGCVASCGNKVSVALKATDGVHVERLANDCGFEGTISRWTPKSRPPGLSADIYVPMVGVQVTGVPQWVADLARNFNITPAKTYTLKPPPLRDRDLILAYLTGLIDSDGCIPKGSRVRCVFHGTEALMLWVKQVIGDLICVPAPVRRHQRHLFRCEVTGKYARRLLGILKALDVPKLARKWDRVPCAST